MYFTREEVGGHVDGVQADLDVLKDLLSSTSYNLDNSTIMGVCFQNECYCKKFWPKSSSLLPRFCIFLYTTNLTECCFNLSDRQSVHRVTRLTLDITRWALYGHLTVSEHLVGLVVYI